ncbi:hypothetical protein AB0D84_19755, partial [Streptomyces sp. NPDC048193]
MGAPAPGTRRTASPNPAHVTTGHRPAQPRNITPPTARRWPRTEPDLSFLLDHTSHVLRSKMSAAL